MDHPVPDSDELVQLLEKQDVIMNCLQEEMALCKKQIHMLKEANTMERKSDDGNAEIIAEAQQKVASALAAVEILHSRNEELEQDLANQRKRLEEDKPVPSVIQLKDQLMELEFELERERRETTSIKLELDSERTKNEEMKQKLELYKKTQQDKVMTLSSKLEAVTKELTDLKCKHECLLSDREFTAHRLAGEVEILTQRETYLGRYCEQLSNELLIIRKERTVINSRLSALVEENVGLRAKMLRCRKGSSLNNTIADGQVQKLLSDQSRLIETLREEGQILVNLLENEKKKRKEKIKSLKIEKKELEDRLEKLLTI